MNFLGDPELLLDLRAFNGNPKDARLEPFWDGLDDFITEHANVADERRRGVPGGSRFPVAISIPLMVNHVVKKMWVAHCHSSKSPEDVEDYLFSKLGDRAKASCFRSLMESELRTLNILVPTDRWVAFQFEKPIPGTHNSLRYTGKFPLCRGIQARTARKKHEDTQFTITYIGYWKEVALEHSAYVCAVSLDDKSKLDVGDNALPVEVGVRSHGSSLMLADALVRTGDHNFHLCSLTPSAVLIVEIPERKADSWIKGKLYVLLKDAALEPSSPKRHMAELKRVLSQHYRSAASIPPMLLAITDGGPDHNTKFWSVIIGWILLFLELDLDYVWALRAAPSQSWLNFVERCFSLLNIALQHTALVRAELVGAGLEELIEGCNSLSQLRILCAANPLLRDAWLVAVRAVSMEVGERFSNLIWSDEFVGIAMPCSEDEILDFWSSVSKLDEALLLFPKINTKEASSSERLQIFVKLHMHLCSYGIQMIKVLHCTCLFCGGPDPVIKAVRMPAEVFATLKFAPDPVPRPPTPQEKNLHPNRVFYNEYEELKGSIPVGDLHLPSALLKVNEDARKPDPASRAGVMFTAAKVRDSISCNECFHVRCIYAMNALSSGIKSKETKTVEGIATIVTSVIATSTQIFDGIDQVKETNVFVCGVSLFHEDHVLYKVFLFLLDSNPFPIIQKLN